MSDGFGHDMARREIRDLLNEGQERAEQPPDESHCPDHEYQQRVNRALLYGMYALLQTQRWTQWLTPVIAGVVAGMILGFGKLFM